jgi:mannose-1-phosphate guanylyltransferase
MSKEWKMRDAVHSAARWFTITVAQPVGKALQTAINYTAYQVIKIGVPVVILTTMSYAVLWGANRVFDDYVDPAAQKIKHYIMATFGVPATDTEAQYGFKVTEEIDNWCYEKRVREDEADLSRLQAIEAKRLGMSKEEYQKLRKSEGWK